MKKKDYEKIKLAHLHLITASTSEQLTRLWHESIALNERFIEIADFSLISRLETIYFDYGYIAKGEELQKLVGYIMSRMSREAASMWGASGAWKRNLKKNLKRYASFYYEGLENEILEGITV